MLAESGMAHKIHPVGMADSGSNFSARKMLQRMLCTLFLPLH
jgi:hypothetical protein